MNYPWRVSHQKIPSTMSEYILIRIWCFFFWYVMEVESFWCIMSPIIMPYPQHHPWEKFLSPTKGTFFVLTFSIAFGFLRCDEEKKGTFQLQSTIGTEKVLVYKKLMRFSRKMNENNDKQWTNRRNQITPGEN